MESEKLSFVECKDKHCDRHFEDYNDDGGGEVKQLEIGEKQQESNGDELKVVNQEEGTRGVWKKNAAPVEKEKDKGDGGEESILKEKEEEATAQNQI